MKILSKQILYTFIVGLCCGITAIMIYVVFSGKIPFLTAYGLNTGAADINARYLDGYGTSPSATSSEKIYVSDASGYLPDGSVDSGAIVDGTVSSGDILDDTVSITADLDLTTDGADSGLDADLLDGYSSSNFASRTCECKYANCSTAACTATATCSSGYVAVGAKYCYTVASCYTNCDSCSDTSGNCQGTYDTDFLWECSATATGNACAATPYRTSYSQTGDADGSVFIILICCR